MYERDTQFRVRVVRCRTVAKLDAMGLVVRRCCQCSEGSSGSLAKSKGEPAAYRTLDHAPHACVGTFPNPCPGYGAMLQSQHKNLQEILPTAVYKSYANYWTQLPNKRRPAPPPLAPEEL